MATLITAQARIRAAARAAGWAQIVTTSDRRDRFDSTDRPIRTLVVGYNDRGGLVTAAITQHGETHPVGGGQQRLQKIIDTLHTTPHLTGPRTWGGAR